MGVGTILESRRCLLSAGGENRTQAIHVAIEGPVTSQITPSALLFHSEAIAMVDKEARALFQRKAYYEQVERAEDLLRQGKLGPVPHG